MTAVVCHVAPDSVPAAITPGEVHVLLYAGRPATPATAAIGGQLRDWLMRFGTSPSRIAVDFVSIALAVTAADTFVFRDDADNSWSRDLRLVVPLANPTPWEAVRGDMESALRFLSGDSWALEFEPGGHGPPATFEVRSHTPWVDLTRVDCVSLFSGGLDSGVGALDLLDEGKRPLFVSHAYRGDASYQDDVAALLPGSPQRFAANAWPTWRGGSEISQRTRSFNFIAFAALAAQARSALRNGVRTELLIPENGLIALNAPISPRRIGALSTRTTHPHFLGSLQAILDAVGLPAQLRNPYELATKGEMVRRQSNRPDFRAFAATTVSCGVWKRASQQCGRCVPCLIRRAALYAADVDDDTDYQSPDLHSVLRNEAFRDDLVDMLTAQSRLQNGPLERWVAQAGPLPTDAVRRASLLDVHRRGVQEVGAFLRDSGFPV